MPKSHVRKQKPRRASLFTPLALAKGRKRYARSSATSEEVAELRIAAQEHFQSRGGGEPSKKDSSKTKAA